MADEGNGSAERRLYDAATSWSAKPQYGPADLIQAACQALVNGLDSPALCELAGASVRDSARDVGGAAHPRA